MGSLRRFDLNKIIDRHNISYLFETGTWKGDGIAYANKFPFKKIFSTEIMPSIAEAAKKRFSNNQRVEIMEGNSIDILEKKLPEIDGNCLFWLDAHFPGAEEKIKDYNEFEEEDVKLPLKKEIELIKSLRKNYNDLILVDDLRIYEDGPYQSGNTPENIYPPSIRNIDFVYKEFEETHSIKRSYNNEGYLLIIPKTSSANTKRGIKYYLNSLRYMHRKFIY
ncbi:MAG TPA: hypothetical protein VF610_07565 [Segetibacter sp.]|jgi:hypothetical protein